MVAASTGGGHGDHMFALRLASLIKEKDPLSSVCLFSLDERAYVFLKDQLRGASLECLFADEQTTAKLIERVNRLSHSVICIGCAFVFDKFKAE